MRTLLGMLLVIGTAAAVAAPATLRVPLVMYPGQEVTHSTRDALLTVAATPKGRVAVHFDQYGNTVHLRATAAGEAKVLCELADNRIGEVLVVSVVKRETYDRYQRAVAAMSGVEGIDENSITAIGDRVVVAGTLYSVSDLQRCARLEQTKGTVCAARLASAATVAHPELGFLARASVEIGEETRTVNSAFTSGVEGASQWNAVVRFGDVPVLRAAGGDRESLLGWTSKLVARLNAIAESARRDAEVGRPYPVTFRVSSNEGGYQISALWNFGQGKGGEVIAAIPADALQDVGRDAGNSADRLMQWWVALLQDSFRAYIMAERPIRSAGATTSSPLTALYNDALRLRGSQLSLDAAPVALARAYFAEQFAAGRDPLANLLTSIPSDFAPPSP